MADVRDLFQDRSAPPTGPACGDAGFARSVIAATPPFIPGADASAPVVLPAVPAPTPGKRSPSSAQARFASLARPHERAALALAYRILRDRDDAQDAVQDAYLSGLRAFSGFRGTNMRPWLLAIVRNAALRIARARRPDRVVSLDAMQAEPERSGWREPQCEEPTAEARLLLSDEHARARAALAGLRPAYRDILVLRELEMRSYLEIAASIGAPIGTVMSRLARARAELRRCYEAT